MKFFEYINTLKPKDTPNYDKCRQIFESYLKKQGKTVSSKLEFSPTKKKVTKPSKHDINSDNEEIEEIVEETEKPSRKRKSPQSKKTSVQKPTKKRIKIEEESSIDDTNEDYENEEPKANAAEKAIKKIISEKKTPITVVSKIKKTRTSPRVTPPAKMNHANIATQTSIEKLKRNNPRTVSFDSPIAEIIPDNDSLKNDTVNSSGDIIEDSFNSTERKVKPKKKLISEKDETIERVVKKKVVAVKRKGAAVNGASR